MSRENDRERVADFKNQISLSSSNMWFLIVYVDVNIIEIKFKKFTKRDKFSNTKNKTFKRFRRQSRVERYFFFVIQFSRRSKRIKKTNCKKKVLFEFRVQILLKNENDKKLFEHATRAINNNNFINLNQFLTSLLSMSKVKNKTTYRDDKLLNNKHIIVKMLENRSKKYMISFLHTFENKCSHCFTY